MNTTKKYGTATATFGLLMMLSATAQAAGGVDTGASSMTALQTWLMTWIPIAATILIIVSVIAWIGHLLRHEWAIRIVIGLLVMGSASFLVGLLLGTG
ncbi:TrbC/VirB2 family protein (plasmid) [Xanthomonas translucens pv. translucens]|uniref:TrbC/VirB2 family protein n=1 Tax=Xanthomonas campestris pv. translucens TaxID=343 RepID=UPI0021BADC0E|nr:TrbC/VirB2 family protein [Xanthomonas translucens]MCT8308730.1 TrbC/VirB2 family protein [Xanthomonas translucens pv. translucens]WNJ25327.1 TrbC/VirB2 family protein [Xanthomonas translucens pv. translucens]WNJ25373.1 TrbC/VirB2 family protein [Xanthomonas translucens pv. translucens]